MADAYGDALKGAMNKSPELDPEKAKAFKKGFQEPQTLDEGWQNIKNELGFGSNNKPKVGAS